MREPRRDHSSPSSPSTSRSPLSSSPPTKNKSLSARPIPTPAPTRASALDPSRSLSSLLLLPLLLLCPSSACTGAAATSSPSRGRLHTPPPSPSHLLPMTAMAFFSAGPSPPATLARIRTICRRRGGGASVLGLRPGGDDGLHARGGLPANLLAAGVSSTPPRSPVPPPSSRLPPSSLTPSFIPSSCPSLSATPQLLFRHRRRPRRHSALLFASSSSSPEIGDGDALHGDGGGTFADEPSIDEGVGIDEGGEDVTGIRAGPSPGGGRDRRSRSAAAAGRHVVVEEIRRSLREEVLPAVLGRIEESSSAVTTTKIDAGAGVRDEDEDVDVLVLILAVSGGCDSVALLHGVMDLVSEVHPARRDGDCEDFSSSSRVPRFVLHLSEPAGRPEDDHCVETTMSGNGCRDDARPDDEGTSPPMADVDVDGTAMMTIPCEIHVAHFDHRTRGAESDGDRLFVEDLCGDYYGGLPFHCYRWGVGNCDGGGTGDVGCDGVGEKSEATAGEGVGKEVRFSQAAARGWRRRTLAGLLRTLTGARDGDDGTVPPPPSRLGVVLTAHHGDDSDETVLLKFLRGAHLTNLSGIEPVRQFASSPSPLPDEDDDDWSPSSEPTTRGALFARPMLGLRKSEIREFLLERRLSWREDGSNASGKYLRNRVRNELIPLLEDLVGGRDALRKRISNLSEQSRSVKDDLSVRAERYLAENAIVVDDFVPTADKDGTPGQLFPLPKKHGVGVHGTLQLNLVHEEALHRWTERRMAEEAGRGGEVAGLSYEQLRRVCTQLATYPHNTIWSLDLGGGWTVSRRGDTLDLQACTLRTLSGKEQDRRRGGKKHERTHSGRMSSSSYNPDDCTMTSSSWLIVDVSEGGDDPPAKLRHDGDVLRQLTVALPRGIGRDAEAMTLVLKTLGEGKGENGRLPFTPPWRRGRRPIPVKEFLRGQGVPLHRRGSAPLLCCLYPTEDVVDDDRMTDIAVLAVHVDPDWNKNPQARSGWVVGAQFEVPPSKIPASVKEHRHIWLARRARHHRTTF